MRITLIAIVCLLPFVGCKSKIDRIYSGKKFEAQSADDNLVGDEPTSQPTETLVDNVQSIDPGALVAGPQGIGETIDPSDEAYIHQTSDQNYPTVLPREYTGPVPVVDVGEPVSLHWQSPANSSSHSLVVYPQVAGEPREQIQIESPEEGSSLVDTTKYVPGHYVAELNYTRADGGENTHYFPFVVRPGIDLIVKTPEILQVETGTYTIYSPHGADTVTILSSGNDPQVYGSQEIDENVDVNIQPKADQTTMLTIQGFLVKNGVRSKLDQVEIKINACAADTFACKYAQVKQRCAQVGKENWLGNASENMKVDYIQRKNTSESCRYSESQDTLGENGNFGRVANGYRVVTARWPLDPNATHEGCTEPANMPDPALFYVCDFEVISYDRMSDNPTAHKIKIHDQGGLTLGSSTGDHYVFSHMVKGMVDKLDRTADSDLPIYDWAKITTNPTTGQRAPYDIGNVNAPPKYNGGNDHPDQLSPTNVDQMPSRQTPAVWNFESNDTYAQILFSQLYIDGVNSNTLRLGVHAYGDGNESDYTKAKDCNITGVSNNVEGDAKFRIKYWYVPISD